MYYSFFEVFSVGIGPSSSHTVGPMRAAKRYLENLQSKISLDEISKVQVVLYGSLALTGEGHGTLNAVVYGLMGFEADNIDITINHYGRVESFKKLMLGGTKEIEFDVEKDIILDKKTFLPEHSNGMKFLAFDNDNKLILEETYFSVGGGTVARQDEVHRRSEREPYDVPYQFSSYEELAEICEKNNLTISEVVIKNEEALKSPEEVRQGILRIYDIMNSSIDIGKYKDGIIPGGLNLARRSSPLYSNLKKKLEEGNEDALAVIDWLNLWAFAVAEENASGGKIVTAPTMGSAGIVPSILRYFRRFCLVRSPYNLEDGIVVLLTTASAIGSLYRANASISGAEVGCQGEIGVACSMAAGGLAAAVGGNLMQIESAAEIAMEHNLGLTCDPIKGLVQVPCIERNAMGAVKAVNATRLALNSDRKPIVSLTSIIKTMYETGLSLNPDYKETSQAGLATNVHIC